MTTLLKNVYSKEFVTSLALEVKKYYSKFDQEQFIKDVFNKDWKNKELKQRLRHISTLLGNHLPEKYPEALKIILKVAPKFTALPGLVAPEFVEIYGLTKENKKNIGFYL